MSAVNNQEELNKRIKTEIDANPIMLYMKGDRSFPQCGFSARVIDVLEKLAVQYETHDILSDPELRFGMKNYSNWPTFPQLFVKGELLGGSDIVYKMFETGDLQKLLKDKGLHS